MSIWGQIKHGAEKVGGVVTGTADKAGGAIKDSAQDVFDAAMAAIVSRGAAKALDLLLDEAKHAARGALARVTLPVVPGFLHVCLQVRFREKLETLHTLCSHPPQSRREWIMAIKRLTDHDTAGVVVRPAADRYGARPGRAGGSVGKHPRTAGKAGAEAVLMDWRRCADERPYDSDEYHGLSRDAPRWC